MSHPRSILLAVAAASLGLPVAAADPVKVEKAELEKMLPGKTLNYMNVNGSAASVSFSADGKVTYKISTSKGATGNWTVEDNGRYCIKIVSGTANDHCRHVWKTDSGYALGNAKGDNLTPVSGFQ